MDGSDDWIPNGAEGWARQFPDVNPPSPSCLHEGKPSHAQTFFLPVCSDGTRRCDACGYILAGGRPASRPLGVGGWSEIIRGIVDGRGS